MTSMFFNFEMLNNSHDRTDENTNAEANAVQSELKAQALSNNEE